jgi:hypothetical protein
MGLNDLTKQVARTKAVLQQLRLANARLTWKQGFKDRAALMQALMSESVEDMPTPEARDYYEVIEEAGRKGTPYC